MNNLNSKSLIKVELKKKMIRDISMTLSHHQNIVLINKNENNMEEMDKYTEKEFWEHEKGMLLANCYSQIDCLTASEIVNGLRQTINSSRNSTFSSELKSELQMLLKEL